MLSKIEWMKHNVVEGFIFVMMKFVTQLTAKGHQELPH